jgi:hypothetical protein
VEAEDIRFRLESLVEDFEARARKIDGVVPEGTLAVVEALLGAAKKALPEDPVVQAVRIPEMPTYSDLHPALHQVVIALPAHIGIA